MGNGINRILARGEGWKPGLQRYRSGVFHKGLDNLLHPVTIFLIEAYANRMRA